MSELRGRVLQNASRICSSWSLLWFLPMGIDEDYFAVVISSSYVEIFFQIGFKFMEDFAWYRQVASRVLVHSLSFEVLFP